VVSQYGVWVYALLFAIIFVETGLVVMPFLPGDSLLFVCGTLAAVGGLSLPLLIALLITAAVLGDALNYSIGRRIGPRVWTFEQSRWFNRKAFERANAFYERHGAITIIVARFLPFVRTFAPFVAAMRTQRAGALVGIASVAGVRGMPSLGGYCASKAAVIAYLESLRLELRASGVGVVTIAPGYIRTPMTAPNPYPMPFLMDADVFAAQAIKAIETRRSFAVIPWQMGWVARVLRVMPDPLFEALFSRAPHKPRASDR
jgi:membrane protein DedA with SNARE-associated domain